MLEMNLQQELLKDLRPSGEELDHLYFVAEHIMWGLIKELNDDFKVEFEGSFAKNTFLSGNSDIDIFVKVPKEYDEDQFKHYITPMIKKALEKLGVRTSISYASHPYVRGETMGVEIDVCPCYNLDDATRIYSAVDRTPFHTQYIKENLDEREQDEVRILKQFLKAHNLYGANEKVRGFSGYLCELLIIKHKKFIKVCTSDLHDLLWDGLTKGITDVYMEDPVDHNRNVAAGLSIEKAVEFVLATRTYLSDISKNVYEGEWNSFVQEIKEKHFTIPKEETLNNHYLTWEFDARDTYGAILTFKDVSENEEVLYSKARKFLKKAEALLNRHDFKTFPGKYFVSGKDVHVVVEVEHVTIPKDKIVEGPSIHLKDGPYLIDDFRRVHQNDKLYIEEDKIKCIVKRKYNSMTQLLEDHYQDIEYV